MYYRLKDEGCRLLDQIRDRENEINRLRSEIHTLSHRVGEKKYRLESYEQEVVHARTNEENLSNQLADLENEINRGKSELSEIQQKITVTEGEINENDKRLLLNQDRISQIEKELWDLSQILIELRRKLDDKDREIAHFGNSAMGNKGLLEAEVQRGNDRVAHLREILEKLIHDGNADVDVEAKAKHIETLEIQIKQNIEAFDELRKEREELIRNLDYTDQKIRDASHHLESLKHNSNVLEKDNKCLKDDLDRHAERDEGNS